MASLSEIEKLEARYNENPEGRYFAPLADAYRKAGRLDDALKTVQAGLLKHPDYLSAHIVLGRCYLDKKDDASALGSFEKVLTLDSENIIALKSLAEIAERTGDTLAARQWLMKLLVVDSMNSEAEADLYRLGGPIAEEAPAEAEPVAALAQDFSFADVAEEPPAPPPPPPPSVTESPTEPMPAISFEPEPAAAEAATEPVPALDLEPTSFTPDASAAAAPPADIVPFDDSLQWGAGERLSGAIRAEDIAAVHHDDSVSEAAIDFMEPVEHQPPGDARPEAAEPVTASVWDAAPAASGFEMDVGESPAAVAPPPDAAPPAAAAPGDLPLIMPEDVTPPDELARPSARLVEMVSPEPRPAAEPEQPPMLTETMGDLYLKQGFRAEAADVYRRLLAQRPDDEALRAKLAALEAPRPSLAAAAMNAEPVGAWLRRVAGAGLLVPAPAPPQPAPPEGPSPMEAAFAAHEGEVEPSVAVAPSPESEAEVAGAPARPASDAFSLDQIFGAESARPGSAAPAASSPAAGASFDEFFGAAPEAESVRPKAEEPAPAGEDDLNSFNAWLKGLKK